MKKLKLTIEGMHCASCAGNVERSVKQLRGVKSISVSVMTRKAFADADDSVTPDELKKAVSKAGYRLTAVEEV